MERLWAPWRLAYVTDKEPPKGCIFCTKPEEACDKENFILKRGELAFVILNAFPYNNGHMMVIPYRHLGDMAELTPDEMLEMMELTRKCITALTKAFVPDGFNVGMNLGRVAGAGIADHLHIHIVPRWNGDTNFMPVLADIKVMPDALESTYDKLKTAFEQGE